LLISCRIDTGIDDEDGEAETDEEDADADATGLLDTASVSCFNARVNAGVFVPEVRPDGLVVMTAAVPIERSFSSSARRLNLDLDDGRRGMDDVACAAISDAAAAELVDGIAIATGGATNGDTTARFPPAAVDAAEEAAPFSLLFCFLFAETALAADADADDDGGNGFCCPLMMLDINEAASLADARLTRPDELSGIAIVADVAAVDDDPNSTLPFSSSS